MALSLTLGIWKVGAERLRRVRSTDGRKAGRCSTTQPFARRLAVRAHGGMRTFFRRTRARSHSSYGRTCASGAHRSTTRLVLARRSRANRYGAGSGGNFPRRVVTGQRDRSTAPGVPALGGRGAGHAPSHRRLPTESFAVWPLFPTRDGQIGRPLHHRTHLTAEGRGPCCRAPTAGDGPLSVGT